MATDIRNTASATFQSDDARKTKVDKGLPVPLSQCDAKVCAAWANDIDEKLEQINEAFVDGAPITALTVGDATGSPELALDKLPTGTASVAFKDAGITRWKVSCDGSEGFAVERLDSGGVPVDTPLSMDAANGDVAVANGLAVAGGTIANGHADADDVVVGDGSGDRGLTVYSGSANDGEIIFTDTSGTRVGTYSYQHTVDEHLWRVSGASVLRLSGTALRPHTDLGPDIGSASKRFQDMYLGQTLFILGSVAPANADADEIVVGDASGNHGITLRPSATGLGSLQVDKSGGLGGRIRYSNNSNQWLITSNGLERYMITSNTFHPLDDLCDLGIASTNRWRNLYLSGDASIGGSIDLSDPAAELTLGDGSGYPKLNLDKDGTTSCDVKFQSDGTLRWILRFDSNEDLFFNRRDGGGGSLDNPITMRTSTGNVEIKNDLIVRAGLDLESASPAVTVGDGTGAPDVRVDKADASATRIQLQNAGKTRTELELAANEDFSVIRRDATEVEQGRLKYQVNGDLSWDDRDIFPETDDASKLGTATKRWSEGHFVDVTAGGNVDVASASPVVTVGDGTGAPQLLLKKSAGSAAELRYLDGSTHRWSLKQRSDEELIVERYDSLGVKQGEPLQVREADGGVRGKLLHQSYHNFGAGTNTGYYYLPWNSTAEQTGIQEWIGAPAPYDGRLVRVVVRSSEAWNKDTSWHDSGMRLYVMQDGSTSVTSRGGWVYVDDTAANIPLIFDMTSESATFTEGEILVPRIWLDGQNDYGDVRVTCVWEFDQTDYSPPS